MSGPAMQVLPAILTSPMLDEQAVLDLSLEKFRWKTGKDYDAIASLFDDNLVFVHITGAITTKQEWIAEMRSGRFTYQKIVPHSASAKCFGDSAVVTGKAAFTVNGGSVYKLVYTEVYAWRNGQWRLVTLHTASGQF